MYEKQTTIDGIKKPETKKNYEDSQNIGSPENLHRQMINKSEKEIDDFKNRCENNIARIEDRAKKDKLLIDAEDKKDLENLKIEAESAKKELETEITSNNLLNQEEKNSKLERVNVYEITKDDNFKGSTVIKVEDERGSVTGYAIRKDDKGNLVGNAIKYMMDGSIGPTYQLYQKDFSRLKEQGVLKYLEKTQEDLLREKAKTTVEPTSSVNRLDVGVEYYRQNIDKREQLISGYAKLLKNAFTGANESDIPQAAFSSLATEYINNKERKTTKPELKQEIRISPQFDQLMAKYFTNPRVILNQINLGFITSKDPREFEINNQTAQKRLEEYKEKLERIKENNQIPDYLYKQGIELYQIIKGEFKLKEKSKKWFEELGNEEKITYENEKTNLQLEVKYLPGGNIAIIKGISHYPSKWISNVLELGEIYKDTRWVAIEGYANRPIGVSLPEFWKDSDRSYNILMRQLVKNGFQGEFIELDSRNTSKIDLDGFKYSSISSFPRPITPFLYKYLIKTNPKLIKKIGSRDNLQEVLDRQILANSSGWEKITEGTKGYSKPSTKINSNHFETTTLPEGLEMGQVVFSDALSVIKILLMNKMMNEGKIDKGILVDFQGSHHLYYKSFFFEHPEYAFEIALRMLSEVMAGEIDMEEKTLTKDNPQKNEQAMINLLNNLTEKSWKRFIELIGTIPKIKVNKPGIIRRSIEPGLRQRKMSQPEYLNYHRALVDDQEIQKYKEKFIKTMTELFKKA